MSYPTISAPPASADPPKLLNRDRDHVRSKGYSICTEKSYAHWIRRFILFHDKRHPQEMGAPEVEAFLTSLAVDRDVAAATQNLALSAILFLYREVPFQTKDTHFVWPVIALNMSEVFMPCETGSRESITFDLRHIKALANQRQARVGGEVKLGHLTNFEPGHVCLGEGGRCGITR